MPNNTHSSWSSNWQENSLTVAVGLGQWEENHEADPPCDYHHLFGCSGLSSSILLITDSEMTAMLELDIFSLKPVSTQNNLLQEAFCVSAILHLMRVLFCSSRLKKKKNVHDLALLETTLYK